MRTIGIHTTNKITVEQKEGNLRQNQFIINQMKVYETNACLLMI